MAVINKEMSARLRMTNLDEKSEVTYGGVDSGASPDDFIKFSLAVSALRTTPVNSLFLVINSELLEEEAESGE